MDNFDIFMCGFLFCAFSDILFAIANYFVQKAFKERAQRMRSVTKHSMNDQISEMARIMYECCNRYDEQGNLLGNKCFECEEWSRDNHCCCSYNTKEATALYNAGYRKLFEKEKEK